MRAGTVVATSRCWSLEGLLRAEVVDLRAEVVEGYLMAKIVEDISKLIFRRDELGNYGSVRYPVPQRCKAYCNGFALGGVIGVR